MDLFKSPLVLVSIFATACFFLTFITRRIVETAKPGVRKQADENDAKATYSTGFARWWNKVILYALGPFWGVVLALILRDTDFFPEAFKPRDAAVLFGMVAGFLSGFLFKILKKMLLDKAGVKSEAELPSDSLPSPPGES